MKRRFTWIVVLAGALVAQHAAAQGIRVIKIGDINSYSAAPESAQPYRNGWQLAVEQINGGGGINGHPLQVISRDDGGVQGQAAH